MTQTGGNIGDQFPAGQTVVTYTFTDGSQNEATCEVVIILTGSNNYNFNYWASLREQLEPRLTLLVVIFSYFNDWLIWEAFGESDILK